MGTHLLQGCWVSGLIAERVLLGLQPLTTTAYSSRV